MSNEAGTSEEGGGFTPEMDVTADELFSILGNETRLAIIRALWEGKQGSNDRSTFSELRERVGVRDSGQFNYHLNQLLGTFVSHDEDGYHLRGPGQSIMRALIKGSLTESAVLDDVPVSQTCPHCDAGVVLRYDDDMLYVRCSECDGTYSGKNYPRGTLSAFNLPPVATLDRTPDELFRHATIWSEHQNLSVMRGTCPECAGRIETNHEICSDHEASDDGVCPECHSKNGLTYLHSCQICGFGGRFSPWIHAFTDPRVGAFYADHGYESLGPSYLDIWHDTVEETTINSSDPLSVTVVFSAEGDRMTVELDEAGQVTDLSFE